MSSHLPKRLPAGVHPKRRPENARRVEEDHHASRGVLAQLPIGRTPPLTVLETLIRHFNGQHTARQKAVSHKTRHDRALFLRRFFRDLQDRAGFAPPPDPRNLGQRHIQAAIALWQRDQLAPATIQTYFSFLRGLAVWLGKPGFVREPSYYGLVAAEYERHEYAQRDKSWEAHGIDVEATLAEIAAFDPRVAASIRLMHVFGLRRKESVTFCPFVHVVPVDPAGTTTNAANYCIWIKGKGGRERWLAVENDAQRAAIALAQSLATSRDAHMGDPAESLKHNLRRLDYVLSKFGFTRDGKGATAHGLRHGRLNTLYEESAGVASPVRGGPTVTTPASREARQLVAEVAGHSRLRAAGAYLGGLRPLPAARSSSAPPGVDVSGTGAASTPVP
jgi:site-specific recombinase XerC